MAVGVGVRVLVGVAVKARVGRRVLVGVALGGKYRGQRQRWYALRFLGTDADIRLDLDPHPEFDAWRWSEYWAPMESVIEFKRDVYQQALAMGNLLRRCE